MNSTKKQESQKSVCSKIVNAIKFIAFFIGLFCNVLTMIIVINSSDKTLADIGCSSSQLKMAEEYKANHDYSNALNMYKKVLSTNDEKKYYAAYNIGRIYSDFLPEKDYQQAWEYYSITVTSNDINILKWSLSFVMEQYTLYKNESHGGFINILDNSTTDDQNRKSNMQIVINLLNQINRIDSQFANAIASNFPISTEEDIIGLFNGIWENTTYCWKYVGTRLSDNSAEAFENENEKLVLVDTYQELVSETAFSTVTVYKYFRYKSEKAKENKLTVTEIMKNYYNDKLEPILIF
jgi:tetratricopeptide (TPR) repeat protein